MAVKYHRRRGTLLELVRQFNKAIFNRLILTFAGRHVYAVVHHVGRRSGHAYTTPVVAVPIADGFIIALTFGADTDWCRNVLAAGQCTLHWHGLSSTVCRPEVVEVATVRSLVPSWGWPLVRLLRVRQFLKLYRPITHEDTSTHTARQPVGMPFRIGYRPRVLGTQPCTRRREPCPILVSSTKVISNGEAGLGDQPTRTE
jgi:deazaflavin-dependent oxidoreductase (nitroreductase family)